MEKVHQIAGQYEQEYCPLCGGGGTIELPQPIPEKFHPLLVELLSYPDYTSDPTYHIVTCACCVFNQRDQPSSIEEYSWAFNDVTACYLGIASDQQWFRVCVTESDLPNGDIVSKWADHFGLSMEHIAW